MRGKQLGLVLGLALCVVALLMARGAPDEPTRTQGPGPEQQAAHEEQVPEEERVEKLVRVPSEVPEIPPGKTSPSTRHVAVAQLPPNVAPRAIDWFASEFDPDPKQVESGIRRGVTWMKKRQQRNGSWGPLRFDGLLYGPGAALDVPAPVGPTALALYALLSAYVPEKDPVIRKGFQFLKKSKLPANATETSMLLLAVTATADRFRTKSKNRRLKVKGRYRAWATKLVDHLIAQKGPGGWRYGVAEHVPSGGPHDLFSTHLAALALFAADGVGISVKPEIWEGILAYTLAQQQPQGDAVVYSDPDAPGRRRTAHARGFAYVRGRDTASGGTTACGLANLSMCRLVLSDWGHKRAAWDRRADASAVETAWSDGLGWLVPHMTSSTNPRYTRGRVSHTCWMWNLQCAMDLAQSNAGQRVWYRAMATSLLERQHPDGRWQPDGPSSWVPAQVLDTSFALLFLLRASARLVRYR